jgi:hypothetical protein
MALRTPRIVTFVAARGPARNRYIEFPVGGDFVNPRRFCSSCSEWILPILALYPSGLNVPYRHSQQENQLT